MGNFFVDNKPTWVKREKDDFCKRENYRKIIDFYLLNTPVTSLSSRSVSLCERGWVTPWRKPFYLNRQLKQSSSNYKLLFSAATYNAVEEALTKADLKDDFPSNIEYERVCIYDNQKNQFMSLFYHLRNSLAHGRFNIELLDEDNYSYIFEDVAGKGNRVKVSARMIIREDTLLKWIKIITDGETNYIKQDE